MYLGTREADTYFIHTYIIFFLCYVLGTFFIRNYMTFFVCSVLGTFQIHTYLTYFHRSLFLPSISFTWTYKKIFNLLFL